MEVAMRLAVLESRNSEKDGGNEADECKNSKIQTVQRFHPRSESEVFVKYEAKVTSRVSSVERRVIYFSKLLFKPNKKKFSLRGVES